MVALGRIDDQERFGQYLAGVIPTLEAHGGVPLGMDDPAAVLEGAAPYPRVVLLKFPTPEAARAWYDSADYQAVAEHRHASSDHVLYLVNELVPPSA